MCERVAGGEPGCGLEDTGESVFVDISLRETFHCVAEGSRHTHGNTFNLCMVYISLNNSFELNLIDTC